MAQASLKLVRSSQAAPADLSRKQLQVEKLGVVLGFLAGLPLAVGPVSEALASVGTPDGLIGVAGVLTVAVSTAAGLRLGKAVAALLAKQAD